MKILLNIKNKHLSNKGNKKWVSTYKNAKVLYFSYIHTHYTIEKVDFNRYLSSSIWSLKSHENKIFIFTKET